MQHPRCVGCLILLNALAISRNTRLCAKCSDLLVPYPGDTSLSNAFEEIRAIPSVAKVRVARCTIEYSPDAASIPDTLLYSHIRRTVVEPSNHRTWDGRLHYDRVYAAVMSTTDIFQFSERPVMVVSKRSVVIAEVTRKPKAAGNDIELIMAMGLHMTLANDQRRVSLFVTNPSIGTYAWPVKYHVPVKTFTDACTKNGYTVLPSPDYREKW